ncbi:MAG: septum formation initiator family protein [Pseudomonadota bacterium]
MKALVIVCVVLLVWLQYTLWLGSSGHFAQQRLQQQLDQQLSKTVVLSQRNKILTAEVMALKQDNSVLEARARRDLGLVKSGEIFYLIPND